MSSLWEIIIKSPLRYHYNDIANINNVDLGRILVYAKLFLNFFIYHVAYKTPYLEKPLRNRFDIGNRYIEKSDGDKYLSLLSPDEKFERLLTKL